LVTSATVYFVRAVHHCKSHGFSCFEYFDHTRSGQPKGRSTSFRSVTPKAGTRKKWAIWASGSFFSWCSPLGNGGPDRRAPGGLAVALVDAQVIVAGSANWAVITESERRFLGTRRLLGDVLAVPDDADLINRCRSADLHAQVGDLGGLEIVAH